MTGRITPFFRRARLEPLWAFKLTLCENVRNDIWASLHNKSSSGPFIRLKRLPLSKNKETSVSSMVVFVPGKLSKDIRGNKAVGRRSMVLTLPACELTRACISLFSL